MSQDGSNDLVGVYVTAGHKIFVDRMQLEQSHFSTPFTLSTRPTSDLEFNLHRDYQLDWSKDWSIVYWKKPIGTSNNSMSGYSIDSLGSNSNTLGGGYVWWGKNNGSNSNNRPSFNFSPQNYFGIWHMMSVVKKGSTITFTHHSPKTGVNAGTVSATFSNANYYVTQRGQGYDLKLGGWDDTQASNTWLRDLVIAKRAFTQEELTRMFKANMSNKTGILTVNNQIKEKKSL